MEIFHIDRSRRHLHSIRRGFGPNATTTKYQIYRSRNENNHWANITPENSPAAFLFEPTLIPIKIRGAFKFPAGTKSYHLVAEGPGNFSITSKTFSITGTAKTDLKIFTATEFSNPGLVSNSPFSVTGNWTLRLLNVTNPGNAQPVAVTNLTLDFYFFLGDQATFTFNTHQLELIQLAVPPFPLVSGRTWNQAEAAVIHNLTDNLWQLGHWQGRCYDIWGGASHHVQLVHTNGSLNFETFIANGFHTCNCYDLAFVANAMCLALGKCTVGNQLVNVVDSHITLEAPWGYVNTGPLFGFDQHVSRSCNSPFWSQYANIIPTPWFIHVLASPLRTAFARHCYLVVSLRALPNTQHVVDACQSSINANNVTTLHAGTETQAVFRAASICQHGAPLPGLVGPHINTTLTLV